MPASSQAARLVPISGVARPTPAVRARLTALYGDAVVVVRAHRLFNALDAIDVGLAPALHRAFESAITTDGRVDMLALASHVLGELRDAQAPSEALTHHIQNRALVDRVRRIDEDEKAVRALAVVIDEAFGKALTTDGRIDFRIAAAHVLRAVRETSQ